MPPAVFDHLAALGDTTRSRLLALLEEREFTVGELQRVLALPQSTVSGHLKVLSDTGWVSFRAHGKNRFYRIADSVEPEARALWEIIRSDMEEADFRVVDRERARSVLDARVDRSREFFSRSAEHWDQVRTRLYGAASVSLPLLGLLDPDWVVADLGCGTGQLSMQLHPHVRKVIAVDRSPEMLAAVRRRAAGRPGLEVRRGELEALPLRDGEVHLAVLSLVLHLVVDPPAVLSEAFRILASEGRLLLVDLRAHERLDYEETMGHLWPGFEAGRLEGWLRGIGFEVIHVRPVPPDPEADGPLLLTASAVRS